MKSQELQQQLARLASHPVRGAWIEIMTGTEVPESAPSHPVRGAWIEIKKERRIKKWA